MRLLKHISFAAVSLFFLSGCGESSQELWKKANNDDFSATKVLAESGDAKAQHKLGFMYDLARGVPEDNAEAVKWYRSAAEQGYAKAQYSLGVSYQYGNGVPHNPAEAYAWYSVAAAGGHADAVRLRDEIAGELTPEQLAEGQKRATELLEKISGGK